MRTRTANPLFEAHGRAMRLIEFLLPPSVDPMTLQTQIEAALGPGAPKLYNRGDNQVHGSISTQLAPNGAARYVCIALHVTSCAQTPCPHSVGGAITVSAAPALPLNALSSIASAIGEDQTRVLTGGAGDAAILQALGFRPPDPTTGLAGDPPLR